MSFKNKTDYYVFVAEHCEIDVGKLTPEDCRLLHAIATEVMNQGHFEDWGLAIIAAFLMFAEEQDLIHAPKTEFDSIN